MTAGPSFVTTMGTPLPEPSRWLRLGKQFTSRRESACVASFDHRPRNHPCPGANIRQAVEIDVVQDARAVERQCTIAHGLQFLGLKIFGLKLLGLRLLVAPVVRAKAFGQTKYVVPCGRRDENLDPHQIGGAARTAILRDAPLNRHVFYIKSTPAVRSGDMGTRTFRKQR
jgi:hypothetical protein